MPSRKLLSVMSVATALVGPAAASAQPAAHPDALEAEIDQAIALLRQDVRAGKAEIVRKTMELDSSEAEVFWPIYEEYQAELQALADERLAIVEELAEHYESLEDARARSLLERHVVLEEKKLSLMKKYKDRMLEALPVKLVVRFLQVESRLNHFVELTFASQIPLVY